MTRARRVHVRTYGCQMNVHDSEKLANLLLHHGYHPAEAPEDADLLLINTCSIRDKAEQQLYSDLGALRAWREEALDRVLAVGGCVAQQEGAAILRRFPQVDFVFGTHNLRLVPELAEAATRGLRQARVEESRSLERFDLPERHPEAGAASPGSGATASSRSAKSAPPPAASPPGSRQWFTVCPSSSISTNPSPTSRRVSSTIAASGRLRSRPRVCGTMQKVQRWSQPSTTVIIPLWLPSRLIESRS